MIFGHHNAESPPEIGCAYVARIDFDYGAHVFKRGQDFDWKALGLVESQARDLWVAGRLLVKEPKAPQQPKRKGAQ